MKRLFLPCFLALACSERAAPPAVPAPADAGLEPRVQVEPYRRPTTDGEIALANLEHQIRDAERRLSAEPESLRFRRALIDLLETRLRFTNHFEDFERLIKLSAIAKEKTASAEALLLRAKVQASLHRFPLALADLDLARARGAVPGETLFQQRATILIAIGRAAEVIAPLEAAATATPSLSRWSMVAAAHAALGACAEADRAFARALQAHADVSPLPVAWVQFRRGQLWGDQCADPDRGAAYYREALRHLPRYAAANIHLAELEVARNEPGAAIKRLERVVEGAADPEPLALLAQLYLLRGRSSEAERMETAARTRMEALLARYPEAFWEHGARFYLPRDVARARLLSEQNATLRPTPDAEALAARTASAAGDAAAACDRARRTKNEALVRNFCR